MFRVNGLVGHALVLVFFSASTLFVANIGFAQDEQADEVAAEALVQEGLDLRRQGNDERALTRFLRAVELHPTPRTLAQVGLAAQALGRWLQADEYMTRAFESPNDAWITRNREPLDRAVATINEHLGSIDVRTDVEGAMVRINGEVVGATPLEGPIRVIAGRGTIELTADDYYPVSRDIDIVPGALTRESIPMRRRMDSDTRGADDFGRGSSDADAEGGEVDGETEGDGPLTSLGVLSLGVGVVGVAVGLLGLFLREGAASSWNDDAVCLAGGKSREENCAGDRSSAETWGTVSLVGFLGGGVLAAIGVALLVVDGNNKSADAPPTDGSDDDLVRISCGGGPGELGIACRASF